MGKTSKVVVCGAKKSGKTSILEQAIYGNIGPFPPTVEDVYAANVDTDRGTREKIRFYDTEGLDGEGDIPGHLLGVADGFIVVYSIDDERSFHIAERLKRDIDKHKEKKEVPVLVLGNKSDLSARRQVDNARAIDWALREKSRLYEVSSLDRESLQEPLRFISSKLNPPPNKSTFSQLTMGRKA